MNDWFDNEIGPLIRTSCVSTMIDLSMFLLAERIVRYDGEPTARRTACIDCLIGRYSVYSIHY
jgi:hypothetical protein